MESAYLNTRNEIGIEFYLRLECRLSSNRTLFGTTPFVIIPLEREHKSFNTVTVFSELISELSKIKKVFKYSVMDLVDAYGKGTRYRMAGNPF